MKKIYLAQVCACYLLSLVATLAQITVSFPSDRAVFQRNNSNQADVVIAGYFTSPFSRIEARFTPLPPANDGVEYPGNGNWGIVEANPVAGNFYGTMTVKGGWYKLEVRGINNGQASQITTINHVGVGEVFLVAGQSNATGGDENANGPGAQHDQVNSVNFQNVSGGTILPYNQLQLPCPEFVHLDALTKTAPFGNYAWCWGSFGDKIYEKQRVPVMIFNAGWSSTEISNWSDTIDPNGVSISAFGYKFPNGLPFGHLRVALNNYIAQLGVRAILWHQGESDNYIEQKGEIGSENYDHYLAELWKVISASRNLSGKSNLAWVVARASRFNYPPTGPLRTTTVSSNVIRAQNEIIDNNGAYPHVYQGPYTDPYFSIDYRADEVHFRGDGVTASPDGKIYSGLISLAGFWADQITDQFLTESIPYSATPPPHISVSGNTTLTLTAPKIPSTSSYNWLVPGDCNSYTSESQQLTVGAGLYQLKIIDQYKNAVLSPKLYASGTALPVTLKYLKGQTNDNLSATLDWATTEESNASHFEVERSNNAVDFASIQKIPATGNSTVTKEYSYNDYLLSPDTYYYRLKLVDVDGSYAYSRMLSLKIGSIEPIKIFPNPVATIVNIESKGIITSVEVVNSLGMKSSYSTNSSNSMQLDMSKFSKGIYTILVNGESFKVVK